MKLAVSQFDMNVFFLLKDIASLIGMLTPAHILNLASDLFLTFNVLSLPPVHVHLCLRLHLRFVLGKESSGFLLIPQTYYLLEDSVF